MNKESRIKWFSLILFLAGMYVFIYFEDLVLGKDYVDGAITTKNRGTRSFIYVIAQNKYGFWIVRCIPLVVSLGFGRDFMYSIRKRKQ